MSEQSRIKTPQTHPDHETVGKHFGGSNWKVDEPAVNIYYCDSYDPSCGFWLTNINDPTDRKNVSERAIGGTFFKAEDRGDHWYIWQWHTKVPKKENKHE